MLRQGVQGISDIITIPGVINRDFADVKTTMAGMGYAVMGTAMRSGKDRASEAALAAMASPLLEAGAIDGARGVLINITGSSTLKLSEVNEASTIIQNAAHEDCNIIFGAVQDERMGDDVKITVIATGFRQQQMPQRRERMLAEATLPAMHYDVPGLNVPIRPRADAVRPAAKAPEPKPPVERAERVAEVVEEIGPEVTAGERGPVTSAGFTTPELVPVRASVFDDDFFKAPVPRFGDLPKGEGRESMTQRFSATADVQSEEVRTGLPPASMGKSVPLEASAPIEPMTRMGSFTELAGVEAEEAESDELDIPAFLRRGNA